jgi:hypothetical protein
MVAACSPGYHRARTAIRHKRQQIAALRELGDDPAEVPYP